MFTLTSEQRTIQQAARDLVRERLPVAHLRALRDRRDPLALSRPLWRELAALGWAGALVPEELGGSGLGLVELGLILEECGRTLAPTPILSTAVLGAGLLLAAASPRRDLLAALCAGDALIAVAFEEQPTYAPRALTTTADRTAGGWTITGAKVNVLDGPAADHLIVSALTADGPSLFLLPAGTAGVHIAPLTRIDSRGAANVTFTAAAGPETALLGPATLLDPILDRATAALCAEMLGAAQEVFDRTIAYLKERQQFGVPIGSFQALKHRAARMYCDLELTRSLVRAALHTVDPTLVSAAKARTSDTFLHIANEAIQLHGGIGATDDLDIGLYLKRARVASMLLGTAAHHRARFATLSGY
ncbi:MAG TPA: acyl-CoA dehydrogenase family protein [Kofleriaceae bacterium]|jgi:acyl-CoA dehydrogenase|nr:acyl-CoA dehydrogenase family protein [Kofleriaceae bacterium]